MLGQVVKGFAQPLTPTHSALLHRVLLPLHRVNEMYEWRDQIPLIQVSEQFAWPDGSRNALPSCTTIKTHLKQPQNSATTSHSSSASSSSWNGTPAPSPCR